MHLSFHQLPSPEVLADMPELQALVIEHGETRSELGQGKAKHQELQDKLEEARRLDEEAAIRAYRAGEKDPGDECQEAVRKELEAHTKYLRVRENSLPSIERDLSATAQKHKEKWLERLSESDRKDAEKLASLLEEARALVDRRKQTRGLYAWLESVGVPYGQVPYAPTPYQSGSVTEDMALQVLTGASATVTGEDEEIDPNEGSVRLVG